MRLHDNREPIPSRSILAAVAVLVISVLGAWSSTAAQNVGYHDFSYGTSESAPTGQKPESKAWFNDGIWWASMYNTSLTQFDIYRLDLGTQKWTDTGTPIDDRVLSAADTLWDQASGKLYVVSNLHTTSAAPTSSSSNWGRLYRYTYNSGSQTYVLDSGFPVTVTKGKEEALVLAKDSTGKLWVAYVESSKVMINHSNGSDNVWGNPVVLPVSSTAVSVESDDIATIISFGGNKIGVYWSNQKAAKDYFAIHVDGDADNVWQPEEIALGVGVNCTTLCADDHMNMKTDSAGKIYVASKTSATNTSSPLLNLLVRSTSGVWSRFTYSTKQYGNTRPIVLLDESHDRLYFFASSSESGADIVYKSTSMSSPAFPDGNGAQFIHSSTDKTLNNATSTKQNLSGTTGLLVIASDDDTTNSYVHNYISLTTSNAPTVDSFTPTSGLSGTSVVVNGTKFTGASSVRFNGVTASFAVNSATQITATVPTTATTGPISVTNSSGTGTSVSSFTVGTPAPTITSISPTSGIVGASVTIAGTNFTGATGVAFNGTAVLPQNFTINSDTSITALVPSGATTGKITVTNPSATATSGSTFTVKPAITSLSPASGAIGLPVTINGTSLAGTTSVKFFNNKTATFSVISDTQVNTTVPAGSTTGNLTVTTPGGTATSAFTVASPPTLSSFSPASGPVGTAVTLNGTNLTGSTAVSFNGTAAVSFTVNSSTKITATVPNGASSGVITVTAPGGPASSSTSFAVTPAITGFSPTSGGPGTPVTLTGTSFAGATAVKFHGISATFNVIDDSHIAAAVPVGATSGTLSVTTPAGTANSSGTFTVLPPPIVSSFTPSGGAVGTVVTITGSHFGAAPQGARTVKFNGVLAGPALSWSDTSISVQVPVNATIGPISVTADGTGTSSTNFVPAPVINSFAPNSGAAGTVVLLTGINFTGASAVSFNGSAATSVTVDSDSSIHATVPAGASTGAINVTTPSGGTGSSASNFTISPVINQLLPTSGAAGTSVTITGSGFGSTQGASTVNFGGTSAGAATAWGTTSITVIVPNVALGAASITVNVGGISSNGVNYTVTPCAGCVAPILSSFSPFEGPAGSTVTLNGSNFTGTTIVTFNGTAANFQVVSDGQITATVPAGATTGPISVTNAVSTAQSSTSFVVSILLGNMTFENGLLIDPTTGGDNPNGGANAASLVADSVNPLKGSYSAHVPGVGDAYVQKAFGATLDDLYVTLYLRPNAIPATTITIAQIGDTSSPTNAASQIQILSGGQLRLVYILNGSTTPVGDSTTTMTAGQPYRVLLHQKKGSGSNAILEAFLAAGDAAFGSTPFASTTAGPWTNSADKFKIGNLSLAANTIDLTFDNVQIESGAVISPNITGISPTSGAIGATVTITGTRLDAATQVTISGTPANIASNSATQVVATVASGTSGSGPVIITTPNGVSSSAPATFTVVPPPAITTLSSGTGAVGQSITITGTDFGATPVVGSTVTFNGTTASVTSWGDTSIVVPVPAGAASGSVVVSAAGVASNGSPFIVTPVITNLSPNSGPIGAAVTITGTSFGSSQGVSTVTFNNNQAATATNWSDTSITVTVPSGAVTGDVVVTVGGNTTPGANFTVVPPPTITNLSAASGAVSSSLTITGLDFGANQSTSTVKFNGVTAGVSAWSDTSIAVAVPAGATTGNVVVTVGGVPSNGFNFTVLPNITGVSPGSGAEGTSIIINGTSFGSPQGSSTVNINGTPATNVTGWSDTSISVTVPIGAAPGSGTIVVTVGGQPSNGFNFTVIPAPSITGLSPNSGLVGSTTTIQGTNFGSSQGSSTVSFNGTNALVADITAWSDISITVKVPAGATSGNVVVTVGGVASNGYAFGVMPSATITGFTPNSGLAGTTQVTITGTNLNNASTVSIAGTAAAINSNSASQIVATVGNGATGSGPIVVTTPAGIADSTGLATPNFTVIPPAPPSPVITSFTPTGGGAGTSVTINGLNFTGTTAVKFNGTAASFTFINDSQLTATVPAGATTGPISVTNGSGTGDTSNLNPASFGVTRVKDITFEAGSLTGGSGFTSTTGTVTLQTGSPLKGANSMTVNTGSSYGTQTYTATDEIFISLYVKIGAIPAGQVRLLRIISGTTTLGAITLEKTTGVITLRNGTTTVGVASAPLTPGTVYRIGFHQKKGTGSNAILQAYLAADNTNFGAPFASSTTQNLTSQTDSVQVGATTGTAGSITFDDIRLDKGSMPGP